jgi:hypothetical protein
MCLIIHGPSAKVRSTLLQTDGLLEDIFGHNEDGLGVMYRTSSGVQALKILPHRSLKKVRRFIESLPIDDREVAMHWRMRTHGNIDKENCHPYAVEGGGWLMHNGILATGNDADRTKSDTWHYARDFLDGGVMERVGHDKRFLELITDHIGSGNKFVMMTSDGRMSIAGKHRGIEVGDLWFSNTYAWSPEILIPNYSKPVRQALGGYYGGWQGYQGHTFGTYGNWDEENIVLTPDEWGDVLAVSDAEDIAEVLSNDGAKQLDVLLANFEVARTGEELVEPYRTVVDHLVNDNRQALKGLLGPKTLQVLAEAIGWFCWWAERTDAEPEAASVQPLLPALLEAPNEAYAG